jgi:hypothetical protein
MNTNKSAEVPERLGCGHSKRRPGGTTQPAGEPRAAGLERPGNGPRSLVRKDHRGTRGGRVMAYKSVAVRRRCVSYANGRATGRRRSPWLISGLKPYWGKPAVRNFRGGGGNMPTSPVRPPRRLMDIGLYPARDSVMRLPPTRQNAAISPGRPPFSPSLVQRTRISAQKCTKTRSIGPRMHTNAHE